MLNLSHHSESASDFLNTVINSKRNSNLDPNYKSRLELLRNNISNCFNTYDDLFATNKIQNLVAGEFTEQEKEDIWALYSYHSVIMQKLKKGVTTIELNRIISTCQNCTIGEINSFDHSVPKNEFPEFVVHPKNLFPSCTRCNSHKSKAWREDGERLFLNLYLDQLPRLQFLFVEVVVKPGDIGVKFSIKKINDITPALFSKISYHFEKLHLCSRFSENCDKVITPLKNAISASLEKLTIEEAIDVAISTANRNREAFGYNYWKSLLELRLLESPEFIQMCIP